MQPGQGGPPQRGTAHRIDQGISQGGQQHAKLIRPSLRARGAIDEQVGLLLFYAILHLSALVVHPLIQLLRLTLEVDHDEAGVSPLGSVLDTGDDSPAPAPAPGARGVRELGEQSTLASGQAET